MEAKGRMIVIVAPSGTGKTTLIKKLREDFPKLKESVSCTTRPIRTGEVDGVNYHFISKEDFEKRMKAGEFLEWAQVHSNYYGTSKTFVENELSKGAQLLFDIDVQGADSMRKHFGSRAKIIFIAPPSIEELERRLNHRATDSKEVIALRLQNAKKELLRKNDYDYLVLNDDLKKAHEELKGLFQKILA